MNIKYYKEKPASGRYVLVEKYRYLDPDGDGLLITAICKEKPGYEFFPILGVYVPEKDAKGGIYVKEEDFLRCRREMAEASSKAFRDDVEDDKEEAENRDRAES